MPELPEVETIVRGLQERVLFRTFFDVWTDFSRIVKKPKKFGQFKKEIKQRKIQRIWRRGKNILFDLSGEKTLLIHQKLTGHLLVGYWILDNGYWKPKNHGPLEEKINTYIHLLFTLDNGQMLALSDLRKFAKVEFWDKKELINSKEFKELGPDPLEKNFTLKRFKEAILKKKKGKIKQVLMDQTVIAGIGNIYSDETLWEAKVSPFKEIKQLKDKEIKKIYDAMRRILEKAIRLKGASVVDFRDVKGRKGRFDRVINVYRREGKLCPRCEAKIEREKIGGRSTHFCPECQPLD